MRYWFLLLMALSGPALADATVDVCYGYGCLVQAEIHYSAAQLKEIDRQLHAAVDPSDERKLLSLAIGRLYRWAGEQSAIKNDRGGNFADDGRPGKMDCIDHSTSTTRLLKLLEARGDLRWHRVLPPDVRYFAFVFPAHYSAVIEEKTDGEAARFVVDSWFVNNGEPAVILPLEDWKKGAGPNV